MLLWAQMKDMASPPLEVGCTVNVGPWLFSFFDYSCQCRSDVWTLVNVDDSRRLMMPEPPLDILNGAWPR